MNARPYHNPEDRERMLALARLCPAENVHVVDLPYRLSSWAFDSADNVSLWEEGDTLLGWGVVQSPFWALDYALHPDAPPGLHEAVLDWGKACLLYTSTSPRDRTRSRMPSSP